MTIHERLERLYKRNLEKMSERIALSPLDEDGRVSSWLISANRTAAMARYILYSDVIGF